MHAALIMIPVGVLLAVLSTGPVCGRWHARKQRSDERAIQAADDFSLPDPGQSLRRQLDPLDRMMRLKGLQVMAAPVLMVVLTLIVFGFMPGIFGLQDVALLMISSGLMEAYLIFQYRQVRNCYKKIQWGYQAKLATARALAPYVAKGEFVCHEMQLDRLLIDHVLVGAKGLFVIQTHTRTSDPGRTVTYDGRGLVFPKGEDDDTLNRACESAETLSSWLSAEINPPVTSRAIVCMPGWRVRRISVKGIPVINPDQFASLFAHVAEWPLSPQQVAAVIGRIKATYRTGQ